MFINFQTEIGYYSIMEIKDQEKNILEPSNINLIPKNGKFLLDGLYSEVNLTLQLMNYYHQNLAMRCYLKIKTMKRKHLSIIHFLLDMTTEKTMDSAI